MHGYQLVDRIALGLLILKKGIHKKNPNALGKSTDHNISFCRI
jgi:hypothetical protein